MLSPDIVTFGVMALTCKTVEDAIQLKKDIDEAGYRFVEAFLSTLFFVINLIFQAFLNF